MMRIDARVPQVQQQLEQATLETTELERSVEEAMLEAALQEVAPRPERSGTAGGEVCVGRHCSAKACGIRTALRLDHFQHRSAAVSIHT